VYTVDNYINNLPKTLGKPFYKICILSFYAFPKVMGRLNSDVD
jgi:hypothetical protein